MSTALIGEEDCRVEAPSNIHRTRPDGKLSGELFVLYRAGGLRPHFENDVMLARVVNHLEAEIIIRPHFEH